MVAGARPGCDRRPRRHQRRSIHVICRVIRTWASMVRGCPAPGQAHDGALVVINPIVYGEVCAGLAARSRLVDGALPNVRQLPPRARSRGRPPSWPGRAYRRLSPRAAVGDLSLVCPTCPHRRPRRRRRLQAPDEGHDSIPNVLSSPAAHRAGLTPLAEWNGASDKVSYVARHAGDHPAARTRVPIGRVHPSALFVRPSWRHKRVSDGLLDDAPGRGHQMAREQKARCASRFVGGCSPNAAGPGASDVAVVPGVRAPARNRHPRGGCSRVR